MLTDCLPLALGLLAVAVEEKDSLPETVHNNTMLYFLWEKRWEEIKYIFTLASVCVNSRGMGRHGMVGDENENKAERRIG